MESSNSNNPEIVHLCKDGKWYFWDEVYFDKLGPYNTKEECQTALDRYCREELGYKNHIGQKYKGEIFKNDGTLVPEDEWIVFMAKDLALVPTLIAYLNNCSNLGCDEKYLREIVELTIKVMKFQKNNIDKCKIPD